jgi:hypothetical protein
VGNEGPMFSNNDDDEDDEDDVVTGHWSCSLIGNRS